MATTRRWWIVPLLALLGLLLKALLLVPFVNGRVESAAVDALTADGVSGVEFASVDGVSGIGLNGLNVILEGPASAENAAVAAVEATGEIDRVTYRTLAGETEDEQAAVPTNEDAPAAEDAPASDPTAGPADEPAIVTAEVSLGEVVLSGSVADEATRNALVGAATERFGAEAVTDELVVDEANVASGGGTLVLQGFSSSENERATWLDDAGFMATGAGFELDDNSELRSVDETLNAIFELEPIEFDSGRATIRSSSTSTLDAAARVLNENPDVGRLLVVGHTDTVGPADGNARLSRARAKAVVDYMVQEWAVDRGRLEFEGRGESEPLVDPETSPEDKQKNRRIEWEKLG